MRAPPADPPAGDLSSDPLDLPSASRAVDPAGARKDRRRLGTAARIAVVVIAVGLLAASVVLVLARNPRVLHRTSVPPRPSAPPAVAFGFTSVRIHALPARRGTSTNASTSVASLTGFYDSTLTRPSTWTRGVPDDTWDAFAPNVRDRATSDAKSLALGNQVPDLRSLGVGSATLDVTVLIDPSGHAQATVARVSIEAGGALDTGAPIQVTVDASFVLRRIDQRWLITGWPEASLRVGPAAPSVGPSAGPSSGISPSAPGGGAAPTPGVPTPQVSP